MNKSKIILLSCTLMTFLNIQIIWGQEQMEVYKERNYKLRPVRIGIKLGFPNIVGGNLEYVTPLLNDRLASSVDYSTIKSDWFMSEDETATETTDMNFSYLEGGLNYYFFKAGKGLYGGVNYYIFRIEANTFDENENGQEGTGRIDYKNSSFSVKLGAKLGGLFYFRPEIGYSFTSLPQTIDYKTTYPDGTTENEIYDLVEELGVPDVFLKGFMANIGIGFAF